MVSTKRFLAAAAVVGLLACGTQADSSYDIVGDFYDTLGQIAYPSYGVDITQSGAWRYQYGTLGSVDRSGQYTGMAYGWDADYRGYGTAPDKQSGDTPYAAGGGFFAITQSGQDPRAVVVESPDKWIALQSPAVTVSSQWASKVIVWTASQDGTVSIDVTVKALDNASNTVGVSLDHWDGSTLTQIDAPDNGNPIMSTMFEPGNMDGDTTWTVQTTYSVDAGDQIQLWVMHNAVAKSTVEISGTIVPEPACMTLLSIGAAVLLGRRRSIG